MATTFVRIEHSVKFDNMKEATREADTLRMNIIRYCKRTKIPCTAMIGISETNIRNAVVVLVKKGKCRPARKVVSKVKRAAEPEKIQPHLHIILLCPSGYTRLSKYLIARIQQRFENSAPDWHIYADDTEQRGYNDGADYYTINDPLYYIKYVIRQSSSIRYVEDYTGQIDFDFKGQTRLALKVVDERTYFHKKMRKNYLEPVEKYHNWCMSKLKSNSNKLAYLKRDIKPTTLCANDNFQDNKSNSNDNWEYEDW